MTLAPIVILITLPVLISLFSRHYRRVIRFGADPRAGGVGELDHTHYVIAGLVPAIPLR
jgi:hypothetical protein